MAGYEIQTLRPDTSVMMDGLSQTPQLIAIVSNVQNSSGRAYYPRVPNAANLSAVCSDGTTTFTISQGSGQSILDYTTGSVSGSPLFVFAKATTPDDPYGIQYVNAAGQTLADQGLPSPQYMESVVFDSSNLRFTYQTADGYSCAVYSKTVVRPISGGRSSYPNMAVLMALPDGGGDDTWYYCNTNFAVALSGGYVMELRVYHRNTYYRLPSLHLYAVDSPVDSGNPWGLKLYDKTGRLMSDSSAETLSGRDNLTLGYSGYPNVNYYNVATQGVPAVGAPKYFSTESGGNGAIRYVGVVARQAYTVRTRHIQDANLTALSWAPYDSPSIPIWSAWTPIADVSHVGYNEQWLAPQSINYAYPSFTSYPQNTTVQAGQTATFIVNAPFATFEWELNGVLTTATGNTYNIANCQTGQSGSQVAAYASTALGRVKSVIATLTVNAAVTPPAEYSSYRSYTTAVEDINPIYELDSNGYDNSGQQWAYGSGNGALYAFVATLSGRAYGPTSGDFAQSSGFTWGCNPTGTKLQSGSGSVAIRIYLKSSGAPVANITCNITRDDPNQ